MCAMKVCNVDDLKIHVRTSSETSASTTVSFSRRFMRGIIAFNIEYCKSLLLLVTWVWGIQEWTSPWKARPPFSALRLAAFAPELDALAVLGPTLVPAAPLFLVPAFLHVPRKLPASSPQAIVAASEPMYQRVCFQEEGFHGTKGDSTPQLSQKHRNSVLCDLICVSFEYEILKSNTQAKGCQCWTGELYFAAKTSSLTDLWACIHASF